MLDAAALSLWAAAGAQKTLAAGLGWLPAVLLGTLTAVGGGAARDLMLQRIPAIFGGNALYASVAMLVAGIQVLCAGLGEPAITGTALGVLSGMLLRLAAFWKGWRLPKGLNWQPQRVLGKAADHIGNGAAAQCKEMPPPRDHRGQAACQRTAADRCRPRSRRESRPGGTRVGDCAASGRLRLPGR